MPSSKTTIPTYYIDPHILGIIEPRVSCLRGGKASIELKLLQEENAAEYYRSHELLAYSYFVEDALINPHYRSIAAEAELEFIPFLPLSWNVNRYGHCNYVAMIRQMIRIQDYLIKRDHLLKEIKPRFTIATTYNLRTQLGSGMPTQVRRGEAWSTIMNFIMSLSLGHYERWPQCPDLLRKSWKYIVELPYVAVGTEIDIEQKASHGPTIYKIDASQGSKLENNRRNYQRQLQSESSTLIRSIPFFFAGNFELFGPELVCSVRNAVININNRSDILVVNTTLASSHGPTQSKAFISLLQRSNFCLIVKGDSYSTSFFYHAIMHGCLPIVISDWFTFSFPWLIPYESFVLRVSEADFIQNPNFVLDYINEIINQNKELITSMRENMNKLKHLLSYKKVTYGSLFYQSLMGHDMYWKWTGSNSNNYTNFETILPFELMMLELRYSSQPHRYYNNIPCLRPYMCLNDRNNQSSFIIKDDYTFYTRMTKKKAIQKIYQRSKITSSNKETNHNVMTENNIRTTHAYDLVDGGYQVNPIKFPSFEDLRTHICRHNTRLIGSYKIVFFMQCVRILWPLQPGKFKPVDQAERLPIYGSDEYKKLVAAGSPSPPSSRNINNKYRFDPDGISLFDRDYVLFFHSFSRPVGWYPFNHPIISNKTNIITSLQSAVQRII